MTKILTSKLLLISITIFGVLMMFSLVTENRVMAVSPICGSNNSYVGTNAAASGTVKQSPLCQSQTSDPIYGKGSVLNGVINIITAIAAFVAVVMIIISGLQMITSSGNPEKISNARNVIIYASIGLIVIALARIIIIFITNKLS